MSRDLFEYHPVIGYRFIPNLTARVRHEGGGYLVQANNLGFRNCHDVSRTRAGKPRVLVFGDSYTAGDGVSNRFRYTDLIGATLPDAEIVNFGLPGSGTDQQFLAWQEYGRTLEHDLLVIAPMVENIVRNLDSHRVTMSASDGRLVHRAKPWYSLENESLILHHSPVPKSARELDPDTRQPETSDSFLRRINRNIDQKLPGFRKLTQRVRGVTWPVEYDSARDPAWLLMSAIVRHWIKLSPVPVLLFPVPTFGHIDGGISARPYRQRFAELSAQSGASLVDPLDAFHAISPAERHKLRFTHDEHPTAPGHRILADVLGSVIDSRLMARDSA